MRITFVSLYHPPAPEPPAEYLHRFGLYRGLPQHLAQRGHAVDFVQLFPYDQMLRQGGVRYRFVASGRVARYTGSVAGKLTRRPSALFEIAGRVVDAIGPADILHVHGTQLHLNLAVLHRKRPNTPLVLHFHGGFPPHRRWIRALQERNVSAADALLFTASEQAEPFIRSGILRERRKVFELVETSSAFEPGSLRAPLSGSPVFLSTCRLHPVKDPMTTLKGFERVLEVHPNAELHHFYRSAELLPELQRYVDARPRLRAKVHFCGERFYDEMEAIYRAADFLLQSSTREFSGCAVLDAMACGVVPVVSDIASFRKITGNGAAGRLYPVGDAEMLAAGVLAITDLEAKKMKVRAFFERELSFTAMAERAEKIYERVQSSRFA